MIFENHFPGCPNWLVLFDLQTNYSFNFTHFLFQNHPDTSEGKGNSEQFQNILEAYRVLSKDETRANYDAHNMRQHWRSQMNSGGNNFNYSDLAQKLTASEHSSMRHQEETARRE